MNDPSSDVGCGPRHAGDPDDQDRTAQSLSRTDSDPTKPAPPADHLRTSIELGIPLRPPGRPGALGAVGSYQILNLVGRGGMGVVVRAFDEMLHRNVALKVMSPALIASERARQRFFREARSAAGINHPNVVTIHAVDEQQGVPFLVMEYVEGQTLDQFIRCEKSLDTNDVIRIGTQIASGLAAAHAQGVIHRDIKPANILLEDGVQRVKLTDFGLARLLVDNSDLTSQGDVLGTPAYMAPEQVLGEEVTARSDLFSLGCVFYTMLCGQNPFRATTSAATSHRICQLHPPSLATVHPQLPKDLSDLVDHLLQKDPNHRPASANEVAARMSRLLIAANQKPNKQAIADPSPTKISGGRRAIPLLAMATLIAALVTAGWYFIGSSSSGGGSAETAIDNSWMVSSTNPAARFATIAAALAAAGPGQQIAVMAGDYHGPVLLNDAARLRGVKLWAQGAVRLTASGDAPVVHVDGVAAVEISGFHIEARHAQNGLRVSGRCDGLDITECTFSYPDNEIAAMLIVESGATGTSAAPMQISRCRFSDVRIGVVVGHHEPAALPVAHLRIEDCEIRCRSHDVGIPLVLQGALAHAEIRNNLLIGGRQAVSILYPEAEQAHSVLLQHNTLHGENIVLSFNTSDPRQDIHIADNLFVMGRQMEASNVSLTEFASWFKGNGWLPSPATDQPLTAMFADRYPPDLVQSLDPRHPLYLQPAGRPAVKLPGRLPRAIASSRL